MLASKGGHLDVVRELLKAQADVNAQDELVCSLQLLLGVCYTPGSKLMGQFYG